ncbi:MAG: hypothetical protein PWR01_3607, partial [Clostridiales bacterium]|nr:hypothetical protein [Clostridiales bacterium]MDN5282534.1 hypothetical protein [Candidatus Ozemobacter sp.]
GKQGWKDGWAEAEEYERSLDDETRDADTSDDMRDATQDTEVDTGEGADTIEDASQDGVADI